MNTHIKNTILEAILENIDIPPSAYEKAKQRYKDLGDWFGRPESKCSGYSPSIYPQGSFRLGTVIRPLGPNDEYDLDMGTRLLKGVTKATHTQKFLKDLVGNDLEAYRIAFFYQKGRIRIRLLQSIGVECSDACRSNYRQSPRGLRTN